MLLSSWYICGTGGRRRNAGRPPDLLQQTYFFFLALFFLPTAFFAFFFIAMIQLLQFWLGKNRAECPRDCTYQRKSQAGGRFSRFAQTDMVHAHHRTTAGIARGTMQGE